MMHLYAKSHIPEKDTTTSPQHPRALHKDAHKTPSPSPSTPTSKYSETDHPQSSSPAPAAAVALHNPRIPHLPPEAAAVLALIHPRHLVMRGSGWKRRSWIVAVEVSAEPAKCRRDISYGGRHWTKVNERLTAGVLQGSAPIDIPLNPELIPATPPPPPAALELTPAALVTPLPAPQLPYPAC